MHTCNTARARRASPLGVCRPRGALVRPPWLGSMHSSPRAGTRLCSTPGVGACCSLGVCMVGSMLCILGMCALHPGHMQCTLGMRALCPEVCSFQCVLLGCMFLSAFWGCVHLGGVHLLRMHVLQNMGCPRLESAHFSMRALQCQENCFSAGTSNCTSRLHAPRRCLLTGDVHAHEDGMHSCRGCTLFDIHFGAPRGMLLNVCL